MTDFNKVKDKKMEKELQNWGANNVRSEQTKRKTSNSEYNFYHQYLVTSSPTGTVDTPTQMLYNIWVIKGNTPCNALKSLSKVS